MTFPSDLDIARQPDTDERNGFGHLPVCIDIDADGNIVGLS